MSFSKVIIYHWPLSQLCTDCIHGEFINTPTYYSSDYICTEHCVGNDGRNCSHFKLRQGEENDEWSK